MLCRPNLSYLIHRSPIRGLLSFIANDFRDVFDMSQLLFKMFFKSSYLRISCLVIAKRADLYRKGTTPRRRGREHLLATLDRV